MPTVAEVNTIIDSKVVDFKHNNTIPEVQENVAQSPILNPPPADENQSECMDGNVSEGAATITTPNYKELKRIDGTIRTQKGVIYKGVKR